MAKLISFVFMIVAAILTVMFVIQVSEIILEDNRFVFFQIILSFVWGMGSLIFWIIALVSFKASRK